MIDVTSVIAGRLATCLNRGATGAALALACGALLAQPAPILKGDDLNETALIDALIPRCNGVELAPGERCKGIRIKPAAERVAPGPAASKGAGASVAQAGAEDPEAARSILITFVTGSKEIAPSARNALAILGRALASDRLTKLNFAIEGHADPRGGEEFNDMLSRARAESVIAYLVEHHGIDRSRLKAVGRGSRELFNPTDPSAPENRRVTIRTDVE